MTAQTQKGGAPNRREKAMRCFWRLKRRHAACGQRVPLPPQQLLVMAAALSLAAVVVSVVVSVMIATGDLPWGEGRGGRCDRRIM